MLAGIKYKKKKNEEENKHEEEKKRQTGINEIRKNEKIATSEDYNEHLIRNLRKNKDEEYEIAESQYKAERLDKYKRPAIKTNQNCEHCIESQNFNNKLLISIRGSFHIEIPSSGYLSKGHCLLVPNTHVLSITELESNEYQELQDFQKDISKMYREELGKTAIFVENVIDLRRCLHTCIECFPLDPQAREDAEMIIYRELSEGDEEWTQNKKIIPTNVKGIRKSIPKGFPYIHIDFDGNGGFAHVIEDSNYFRGNFSKQIIGEILRVDPMFRNRKHNDEELSRIREEFKKLWREYDNEEIPQEPE